MTSKEQNILFAAEKLFAEKGFDATSTREISAAANVNVSMISYYFGSKEQLLEKIFQFRMQQSNDFTKEIMANEDLNEWQKLMLVLDLYTTRVRQLKDFYKVLQTEQITNKNPQINEFMRRSKIGFLKVYEELLKKGSERGIFKRMPRVELLHATIVGTIFYAMNGVQVYREFNKNTLSEEEFMTQYNQDLKQHIKIVLKDLLGYEEL